MSKPEHLGDAVYARFDGYYLILTTSDGATTTNVVYLEPLVYSALVDYVNRLREGGSYVSTIPPQKREHYHQR